MPVKPGPDTGSSSLPSAPVIAKSNVRFCSTCCVNSEPGQRRGGSVDRDPGGERVAHQLSHALFSLFLVGNLDPKVAEVFGEMRIDTRIITGVAVNI